MQKRPDWGAPHGAVGEFGSFLAITDFPIFGLPPAEVL